MVSSLSFSNIYYIINDTFCRFSQLVNLNEDGVIIAFEKPVGEEELVKAMNSLSKEQAESLLKEKSPTANTDAKAVEGRKISKLNICVGVEFPPSKVGNNFLVYRRYN